MFHTLLLLLLLLFPLPGGGGGPQGARAPAAPGPTKKYLKSAKLYKEQLFLVEVQFCSARTFVPLAPHFSEA